MPAPAGRYASEEGAAAGLGHAAQQRELLLEHGAEDQPAPRIGHLRAGVGERVDGVVGREHVRRLAGELAVGREAGRPPAHVGDARHGGDALRGQQRRPGHRQLAVRARREADAEAGEEAAPEDLVLKLRREPRRRAVALQRARPLLGDAGERPAVRSLTPLAERVGGVVRDEQDVGRVCAQGVDDRRERTDRDEVARLHEPHVVASGELEPEIARRVRTDPAGRVVHAHAWVGCRELVEQLRRVVGRGVVDDDELRILGAGPSNESAHSRTNAWPPWTANTKLSRGIGHPS